MRDEDSRTVVISGISDGFVELLFRCRKRNGAFLFATMVVAFSVGGRIPMGR